MKREVWVEKQGTPYSVWTKCESSPYQHIVCGVEKITLHESRWIPVSEKPEREGRYPVIFEGYGKAGFEGHNSYWDGNNWMGNVKLWLYAPPLPVETEPSDFEKWWGKFDKSIQEVPCSNKIMAEIAWNAAKESKCV